MILDDSRHTTPFDYIRGPQDIYSRSFALIRKEANLRLVPPDLEQLVVRVIHACGMVDIVDDIVFSPKAGETGRQALQQGGAILCDSQMVAHGITPARLPAHNKVICCLNNPQVSQLATNLGTTRSAASVELWRPHLAHAVVAVGNAPTALYHLLDMIKMGAAKPALILGFVVGFVGAAESKQALAEQTDIPFITIKGRRGGSAMAAAAVNALASVQE